MKEKERESIRNRMVEILKELSDEEKELLCRVLKIEAEKLYLSKPQIKQDILKAVREIIK